MLTEKVHATIPKGIVDGFEFTVFQRNLKEWLKESSRQEQCVGHTPYYLSGSSRVHFFRQPFPK